MQKLILMCICYFSKKERVVKMRKLNILVIGLKTFGQPVEIGRVNYVLRAINIKPGAHKVELSFFPKTVDNTETIAYIASAILLLVLIFALVKTFMKKKEEK